MTPLIRKEIRLLLPGWIAAMILAIVPAWIAGTAWRLNYSVNVAQSGFWLEGVTPVIFALGLLLLGLSPFGQEFSQGTFTVLLSQPTERLRIWRTKIALAAAAFLIVWLAAIVSIWCQYFLYDYFHPIPNGLYGFRRGHVIPPGYYFNFEGHFQLFSGAFDYAIVFLTVSALVVFSGGLWTTLLLRQVTNAFWFTLLTPLAIILGISSWLSDRVASDQSISRIIVVALTVYSVAGFIAARLLFRRCQDLQGTGGEISFPSLKKFVGLETTARAHTISSRPRHRFIALAWKEIQLHQASVLIAALILLLHLSSLVTRHFHPHFMDPDIQFVLGTIWLLWLLMPILVGCSAIAEERRLGIMESQLSLPMSRRMQLFVKFSIGLILSLLLGAALPLLVEGTKDVNGWLFAVAGGLFFISFYASSMARTVLQAIGLSIVVSAGLFIYIINTAINDFQTLSSHYAQVFFGAPWGGNFGLDFLKVCLGLPILLLALIGLTFWNYKRLRQNNTLLLVNFLALTAVCAGITLLSYSLYYRTWEFVTPTFPLRGPARLSSSSDVKLASSSGAIYAVLPDGRLSIQNHTYRFFPNGYAVTARAQSAFLPGSNWVDAAADNFQAVGIRSDGSLWSIRRPWVASHNWIQQKGPFMLAQIGSNTDWSQVADSHIGFLLLKTDGSLWTWGTNGFDWIHFQSSVPIKLKADLAMPPTRLNDGTGWTQLYAPGVSAYAMNDNGDVWSWLAWIGTNDVSPQFVREYTASGPWSSFSPGSDGSYVEVKTNGELWAYKPAPVLRRESHQPQWENKLFPLTDKKWKTAILVNGNQIMAIRSDGTLWSLPDLYFAIGEVNSVRGESTSVQLGTRSDWITLLPGWQGLALAADGSLWAWDRPNMHIWLAPSRKPAYMGNIFKGSTAAVAANP